VRQTGQARARFRPGAAIAVIALPSLCSTDSCVFRHGVGAGR
jgi:hypothetical protein